MVSQITERLTKMADNVWAISQEIDLVFSEDDEQKTGRGWYLQRGRQTSQLYPSDYAAIKALREKKVTFS